MHTREVSMFNIERTIVDNPLLWIVKDLVARGDAKLSDTKNSPHFQRELVNKWLCNRRVTEVAPIMSQIAKQTQDELAPWAKLVMNSEAENERELGIYSSTLPSFVVKAVALGIERILPSHPSVLHQYGKPHDVEDGKFSGFIGPMFKAEIIEGMQEDGMHMHLIADSFGPARPAINKADRGLLVNIRENHYPEPNLTYVDFRFSYPSAVTVEDTRGIYPVNLCSTQGSDEFLSLLNNVTSAA